MQIHVYIHTYVHTNTNWWIYKYTYKYTHILTDLNILTSETVNSKFAIKTSAKASTLGGETKGQTRGRERWIQYLASWAGTSALALWHFPSILFLFLFYSWSLWIPLVLWLLPGALQPSALSRPRSRGDLCIYLGRGRYTSLLNLLKGVCPHEKLIVRGMMVRHYKTLLPTRKSLLDLGSDIWIWNQICRAKEKNKTINRYLNGL